jgi:uncharacterized protein YukE
VAVSDGFEVTPQELHNTAAVYGTQSGAVTKALAAFEAATNLPDSAFGNLPNSAQFATQFKNFEKQVKADMQALINSLAAGDKKLTTNAQNYTTTEHRNTVH